MKLIINICSYLSLKLTYGPREQEAGWFVVIVLFYSISTLAIILTFAYHPIIALIGLVYLLYRDRALFMPYVHEFKRFNSDPDNFKE